MSEKLVAALEAELQDQPANPLRPHQRKDWEEERDRLQKVVNAPPYVQADRGGAVQRYRKLTDLLDKQVPKPVQGDRANRIKKLCQDVIDRVIRPSMQPAPVMRRRPPEAVGNALRGEFSPEYKRAAQAWKRGQWALDPNSDNPDHTNLERYRRQDGPGFMANSEEGITGYMSFSHLKDEQWPFEPPQTTAVAQVAAREAKERKPITSEAREKLLARLAEARAKKAAKKAGEGAPA